MRGKALKAASHIDRLNQAYDAFNEAAPAHAADVEGLTPQIVALQDDLAFAAQVLGNSVGASNGGAGVGQPETAKLNPEPVLARQTGIPEQTDRVALGPHPDQPDAVNGASATFRAEAERQIAAGGKQ